MNVADILCRSRFRYFQHVPDQEKIPIYHALLRIADRGFVFSSLTNIFDYIFKTDKWTSFCSIVRKLKRSFSSLGNDKECMDVELVLQLFNEEENPTVAHNILLSLVSFHLYTEHLDVESRQRVWNIGTYLLANSRTQTDKEAAVILLTVHMLSEKV